MKKNKKRTLIVAGTVAAGLTATTAVSYAAMKGLVGMAMDRTTPKALNKKHSRLTGGERPSQIQERMAQAEKDLQDQGCVTVETTSFDGLRLVGHWQTCRAPKRVIVAMHGWRSGWARDFGVIAPFLRREGCCVLYAEQRAQGASDGEYMGFGLLERYDCLEWVRWVNERVGQSLPVYLVGISMGATSVLMAAGLELPDNVRGIIADCGFTSPEAIWRHVVSQNLKIPYRGARAAFADWQCKKRIGVGTDEYSTLDAMAGCKIPVLFIHGEEDRFVPVKMTYENYDACASPKRLFVVPGAAHGMSYMVDPSGYEREVKDFWATYDREDRAEG